MTEIVSITTGEIYSFDQSTGRIFKDGRLVSSTLVEPVYSNFSESGLPIFSGIFLKGINSILTLSGKINPVISDNNQAI